MKQNFIQQIRAKSPIVLNIANFITPQHVADGINYVGGSPMMVADPLEVKDLAELANAVTINIGSTNPAAQLCSLSAGEQANTMDIPVILDPVAVGATALRKERVQQILQNVKIDTIRGNIGEIAALSGINWQSHGIDAGSGAGDPIEIAKRAAQTLQTKIVISGPTDVVTDGTTVYLINNNAPMLKTNVGMGDVLDGILGTGLSLDNSLETLAYTTGILPVAAELATVDNKNAATFLQHTYDNLASLDDETFFKRLKIEKR